MGSFKNYMFKAYVLRGHGELQITLAGLEDPLLLLKIGSLKDTVSGGDTSEENTFP